MARRAASASDIALQLGSMLTISNAVELHKDLMAKTKGTRLLVDAWKVERVTTPCIQLLLAAEQDMRAKGSKMILLKPSAPLRAAFDDLGLRGRLAAMEGEA